MSAILYLLFGIICLIIAGMIGRSNIEQECCDNFFNIQKMKEDLQNQLDNYEINNVIGHIDRKDYN